MDPSDQTGNRSRLRWPSLLGFPAPAISVRAPCSWCQRDAGDRPPQTREAVSTDYAGKCILIADVLTLIERNILPDRPVFFIPAGRRGAGKTTSLNMEAPV